MKKSIKRNERRIRSARHRLRMYTRLVSREQLAVRRLKRQALRASRGAIDPQEEISEITQAFRRMENGKFGICEGCGYSISAEQLQAMPLSRYCTDCLFSLKQGVLRASRELG